MAFTLQRIVNKKRLYLVNDFEVHHRPDRLYGEVETEIITFADNIPLSGGELFEGTSNQNDAITFKSFAAAKDFKKKYRLTNWDINFIANPVVSQKLPKIKKQSADIGVIKASPIPKFSL
jgi:hypothetical protein